MRQNVDGDIYTEIVLIYQPVLAATTDRNVTPASMVLVASGIKCNLHRGSRQAMEAAMAAGFDVNQSAMGYFPVSALNYVKSRYVLTTNGETWIIHGDPNPRTRFSETGHICALLQFLNTKPDGVA